MALLARCSLTVVVVVVVVDLASARKDGAVALCLRYC